RLTLIGGVRLDFQRLEPTDIADAVPREHTAFSPKLAAHYKFNDTFAIFGSVAHTQRVPTIDEAFDVAARSLELDKERSNNFEGGFSVSLDDVALPADMLQFKATGFYNRISDLIVDHGQMAPIRYTNTGEARIYGAEFELAYDSTYMFANAAYTYTIGDDLTEDLPVGTLAPLECSATSGGRLPDRDLTCGGTGRQVAAQDRVAGGQFDRQPTEAFQVHDAFLTCKPDECTFRDFEASLR